MAEIFSLTQRWAPAPTQEPGEDPLRAHVIVLINESTGECLAAELAERALSPAELARWAEYHLPEYNGSPRKLWLDDASLLPPLSLYFDHYEVSLTLKAEHRDEYLVTMAARLEMEQNADHYSISESFGEWEALRFYTLAREYFQARPWDQFGEEVFLEFQDSEAQRRVVGIYAPGAGEIGFCLMDGAAHQISGEDTEPLCGLAFDTPAFVSAADLDLLDRQALAFPDDAYPWILAAYLPDGLTREWLEEFRWLLVRIPQLAKERAPIEAEGRQLRLLPGVQ